MLGVGEDSKRADSAFDQLREVAVGLDQGALVSWIERSAAAARQGDLTVAVLGQFKRGKSTLLNALLGQEILPSGLLPVTAVPVVVRAGSGDARIVGKTGSPKIVGLDQIPEYVTETRNPGNRQGIREVDVRIPLPPWALGVTFVDSPGVGSVVEETTAAARSLLPQVDAALYVISPDPPLTDNDQRFLREAAVHATKFFFVLNKVDLLTEDQVSELVEYSTSILRDRCGFGTVRIFPLSATRALAVARAGGENGGDRSGVPALVRSLREYLTTGRAAGREGPRHTRGG